MTRWLVAGEFVRRSFTSRLLVLVGVVAVLYLIIAGCFYGGQFYVQGRVYASAEQFALARAVSYHLAAAWGILFAVMLGMSAAAQPLADGRTSFVLAKPVRRGDVLLGQLLGAFATAAATVVALGAVATVIYILRSHSFPATLWLGLGPALLAVALGVALASFVSLFLPRVVAGMLGIIAYLASWPAAFPALRDFMTSGSQDAGLNFPWWLRWGAEVYFAATPPLAGLQLRGADLVAGRPWGVDGWLTLATGAAFVVVLYVAAYALFARRDV